MIVQEWETSLLAMQETMDELVKLQSQWLYLHPIFSSPDIVDQMTEEANLFTDVDSNWRKARLITRQSENSK